MGRVSGFVDVAMLIRVGATVAVALVALGSMANLARADAALSIDISADPDPAKVGEVLTYTVVVTNTGDEVAEDVVFEDSVGNISNSFDPDVFRAGTSVGSCTVQDPATVDCDFGDLAPGAQATVTVKTVPTSVGALENGAFAAAVNVPDTSTSIEILVGGDLGEENGERVLVEHKGKELCLPEAALRAHLEQGDQVMDEQDCSDPSAKKNGKKVHAGADAARRGA